MDGYEEEMSFWADKRVLVTGGAGFLGSYVVAKLHQRGCNGVYVPRSRECDLRDMPAVIRLYEQTRPHMVIHLAGVVGGIGANRDRPGEFFYDNLMMGAQVTEQARVFGVEKFVAVGTVCAYPKFTPVPFKEENLWDGYPEQTNAPYGLAKKMVLGLDRPTYRARYLDLSIPQQMEAGHQYTAEVTVRNEGRQTWSPSSIDRRGFSISYHWRSTDGTMLVRDGLRTPIPKKVARNASIRFAFNIEAPPDPGRYLLEIDVIREQVGWLGQMGSETKKVEVHVVRPR